MSLDKKTARHICNVTRRQIQNSFPDMHIHFCVHGENARKETLLKEENTLREHPAGKYLVDYHDKDAAEKIMQKNKSRFVSIARHNVPGFLGFFKNESYLALCVINYDRFSSEINLRNHLYSVSWHAISVYKEFIERRKNRNHAQMAHYIEDHNLLIPKLDEEQLAFRNLMADIFSACSQILSGRKDVIKLITRQRLIDTLTPQKGFRSELYPFPVCIDQIEAMIEKLATDHKKDKKTILTAVKMTEGIKQTYDTSILELWKSFSLPAQQMAWAGHTPETILGAALYTCENTYTQSTADMVAEKMEIKPETITSFQYNNPFTKQETNEKIHQNLCTKLIEAALSKVKEPNDYVELLDIAHKQNEQLLKNQAIGWCAGALLRASDMVKHCEDPDTLPNILEQAKTVFTTEAKAINWDTLNHFSFRIFQERLKGTELSLEDIVKLSAENEEFAMIHNALYALKTAEEEKIPDKLPKVHLEQQDQEMSGFMTNPDK